MKTTNRASHNAGKSRNIKQSGNTTKTASGIIRGERPPCGPITVLFQHRGDRVAQEKILPDTFSALVNSLSATGKPFPEFLNRAIASAALSPTSLRELECAIQQSCALNALMQSEILNGTGDEYCDDIKCGLVELSSATRKRLRNAHAVLHDLSIGKPLCRD